MVISRIPPPGIPGFRSRFRASSRGFPRKFLDGMDQNLILSASTFAFLETDVGTPAVGTGPGRRNQVDFRGAGDPLFFFGPLRGAANSSHEGLNQTFALGGESRGGPQACGSVWYATLPPWRPGTSGPWAAGNHWPLGGREALAPGHLPDPPRWSSHGFAGESPASGRDSGRARGDSRGSFWMEWLRIGF